jgi:hypothetical protein
MPSAVYASVRVWAQPETFYRAHPVQPAALLTFMLYSLGSGAGIVLGT